jgi:magnesium-transporting ATPase (P-type)
MIGLKDPVRLGVKDVIEKAERARISLRLVSGDHLETTAAVARDVGILSAEEFEMSRRRGADNTVVMDASEFRRRVGEVVRTANEEEPGME